MTLLDEKKQAIQEIVEELMHHRRLLESYHKQKKKPATTKDQNISKKIEIFLDSYEEVMRKTQLFDQSEKECNGSLNIDKNENKQNASRKEIKWRSCMIVDTSKKKEVRFDIDKNATCLSTSSKSRGSQQQSQHVRPSKSMTNPAFITTSTTQAPKEVQFDLSSTTWHEVNCNDDGTASFIAQRDVSTTRETKYRNVGILRNSRIYRRSRTSWTSRRSWSPRRARTTRFTWTSRRSRPTRRSRSSRRSRSRCRCSRSLYLLNR